jgi:isopentenyl-diphosphate delta-isomerase
MTREAVGGAAAAPIEEVVLLDEAGRAIGTAPKATVHHAGTPLHLAFSCYVFDVSGRLLVTRRALDKTTFPGVWTNTFCGHPSPGEDVYEAVTRRGTQELGIALDDLRLALPAFRYGATMPDGVRENELGPVFTAVTASAPAPDPSEVDAVEWVSWPEFRDAVLAGEREVSVWCAEQVAELAVQELPEQEQRRGRFRPASADDLPPAARSTGH